MQFNKQVAEARDALVAQGFAVIPDALPLERVLAIERALEAHFEATPFCEGDFYGWRTKRFGRLLLRSPESAAVIGHPVVLAVTQAILGPWCDRLRLNLAQAIEIHPGERAQLPHRDEDMWGSPKGELEYLVNVMWPLTPFRADNGATRIWPGSHHRRQGDGSSRAVELEPGSALLFLGSTLHGGGANVSTAPRRGLLVSFCLGWLRAYENAFLAYPPEIARSFPAELAALIGYQQHRPNLGNFEGQCPSILLGSSPPPDHLAAHDALRPDQAAAVAAYVG